MKYITAPYFFGVMIMKSKKDIEARVININVDDEDERKTLEKALLILDKYGYRVVRKEDLVLTSEM